METWKLIPFLNGKYEASSLGNVRHWKKKINLIGNIDKYGYRYFTLMTLHGQKSFKAHRLIASAFIGESDLQIDHINNDKLDNRPQNLRYCTCLENTQKRSLIKFGGTTNINWHITKKAFIVRVTKNGKRIQLGSYKTKEQAIKALQNGD